MAYPTFTEAARYFPSELTVSTPPPSTLNVGGGVVLYAGTSAGTGPSFTFSDSNGVSFGMSANVMTASVGPSGMFYSAQGGSSSSGTLVFANSNGFSFSNSNGSIIGSYTVPAPSVASITFSAGTTSNSLDNVVFSNANGVSFGLDGSTITASVNAGVAYTFSNSNGISFGTNAGTVTASYTVPTVTNSSLTLSVGTRVVTNLARLAFVNSGNITWGMSTNGASATITATTPTVFLPHYTVSAGTSSEELNRIVFADSNGISFGLSSETITASFSAAAATNSSWTVSDSATSGTVARLAFTNLNGVTLSLSSGTGGLHTIVGSHNGITSQSNQNISMFALGNTTQNSSTVLNASAVSFNGLGAATLGYSNGSIQVSVPVQSAQTQSLIQALYDGANSITTGTVRLSNSNGFAWGINGQTLTASYTVPTVTNSSMTVSDANTSGTLARLAFTNLNGVTLSLSTGAGGSHTIVGSHNALTSQSNPAVSGSNGSFTFQTVTFGNLNGLSFYTSNGSLVGSYTTPAGGGIALANSQTTFATGTVNLIEGGGAITIASTTGQSYKISVPGTSSLSGTGAVSISVNGSTISIGVPNTTVSFYEPEQAAGMQANSIGNASLSLVRIFVPHYISATKVVLLQHFTNSTGAVNGATITYSAGAYTMSGSTASLASSATQSLSFNLNSNTSAASQYGGQSGTRYRTFALGTWNLTPGDYLFGIGMRVSTSNTSLSVSHWCRPTVSINAIPGGGNFTEFFFNGVYSASTNAIPASIHLTDINQTGNGVQKSPYFVLAGTF